MDVMTAIIGDDDDAAEILYDSLREFPAKRVVLIAPPHAHAQAEGITKNLAAARISVDIVGIRDTASLEHVFEAIRRVRERESGSRLVVSVDTDNTSSCLALSAAFVNGVQAIGILDGKVIAYPIMKFSYQSALSERKLAILGTLHRAGKWLGMDALGRQLRMSMPLVSYHVNGNLKSAGLLQLGLVDVRERGSRKDIALTQLGRLIVRGQVDFAHAKKR